MGFSRVNIIESGDKVKLAKFKEIYIDSPFREILMGMFDAKKEDRV